MKLNSRWAVWDMTIERGKQNCEIPSSSSCHLDHFSRSSDDSKSSHTATLAEEVFSLWPGMVLGIQWDQRVMPSGSASCNECPLCSSSQPHRHNSLIWCPRWHPGHIPQALWYFINYFFIYFKIFIHDPREGGSFRFWFLHNHFSHLRSTCSSGNLPGKAFQKVFVPFP